MTALFLLSTFGDINDDALAYIDDYVFGLELDQWRTGFGDRTAKDWPADATIFLPKTTGRTLTDLLGTTTNTLYVSKRVRMVIERHCKDVEIEYLPFALRDHRKRLLSNDYVIVNPIGTFDCLDLEASKILWNRKKTKVLAVNDAVLSEKKVKDAPVMFRIRETPMKVVVSFGLARELYDGKYTNVFTEKLKVK